MGRSRRLIVATVLVAMSAVLSGCGSMSGLSNFEPGDLFDFLDTKKKLPGERKAVFPEGVPGLEQGVPRDLYRGARASAVAEPPPPPVVAEPPPRQQRRVASRPQRQQPVQQEPTDGEAAAAEEGVSAAPPAPPPPRRRSTQRQQPQEQPVQQSDAP
ncbi:MAG: hypothetical protein A4S14_00675, partial [Proteobacteria bacterium SG_bin9]